MIKEKKLTDEEIVKALDICTTADDDTGCIDDCPMYEEDYCTTKLLKMAFDLIHRLQSENAKQKAEIERLTEEKKEVWDERNRICKGYWETMDGCHQYREKILELQKQVDELLNRRIEPKIFHCHADTLETCPKVEQAVKDAAKVLCINDNFQCNICPSLNKCFNYSHAKKLYNAGYRKIPEGAVVLTKEEIDAYEERISAAYELGYKESKNRIIKETAEKFAEAKHEVHKL